MKLNCFFIVFFILILVVFTKCDGNKVVPNVCFDKNILPIFISKCTTSGCHSGSSIKDKGKSDLRSYEGILNQVTPYYPFMSEIYQKCSGSNPEMPPKSYIPLTETELAYIKYWIHIGAKNSTNCVVTQCDTLAISFSNRIMPIIQNSCVGCHNSSNPSGGYDLSSYNEIIKSIDPLIGSIKHLSGYSEMPKGSQKLDDCSINVIQKWIDAGHKNN